MVYTITQVQLPQQIKNERKCCVWKEVLLAFLFNIPFFTHGVETTNLTSSAHAGHFISSPQNEEISYTSMAMTIAAGVTAPIYCYVIDRFGRKTGIFIISMVQGITLVPHFLLNKNNIYVVQIILHILAGISSGGLFTILPIYIKETSVMRGFCICLMVVMTTVGYLMKMLLVMEVRLYLMVGLVGVQFFSMFLMVESPCYLVMKKKYDAAQRNLSKLKLLAEDDPNISKEISSLKDESDRAKSNGKLSVSTVYRTKIWLDGIKIGFVLYTVNVLCGSILFLDQHKTLMQLKLVADPESTLVLACLLGGSVCCLISITFLDRKYLLTLGYVIITLSTGVLAVYTQAEMAINSLREVPVISLGILVFGYGIAWGLPTLLVVEMYNMEIRATFIGIIYFYSQVIKLAHVHTFKYLEDFVGVYTMFYIFACVNMYGVVYTLFAVPNTKGKSVKQIEKQLRRPKLPA
ncbi:facilitated trehalose transporter Tret1-like [Anticarsia gemmatalis]|uniref:facilitated trehalose transporter Tret1-like n=1 Tax=Anticarsia gemmatalis TaxID=129554 RepID=UPI003F75B0A4